MNNNNYIYYDLISQPGAILLVERITPRLQATICVYFIS